MFADNINLFYMNKNIQTVFNELNAELKHIRKWLKTIKLSNNTDKTNLTLFHKQQDKESIPLELPTHTTEDVSMEQNLLEFILMRTFKLDAPCNLN